MTFFLPLLLLLLLGLTSAAPVDSGAPTSVTSYNGPMTPELIKAWSAKQKFVGDVGAVSNADDPSFKWKNCWKTDVKGSVKDVWPRPPLVFNLLRAVMVVVGIETNVSGIDLQMRDAIARYCKEAEGVVLKKNNVFLSTFKYAGYGVMGMFSGVLDDEDRGVCLRALESAS